MSSGFFEEVKTTDPVQPWKPEEDRLLIELYLDGVSYRRIGQLLKRQHDKNILDTRLWKLACNYVDTEDNPHDRAGASWGSRELKLLRKAIAYTEKWGGGPIGRDLGPEHVARLVGRPVAGVEVMWEREDPRTGHGFN